MARQSETLTHRSTRDGVWYTITVHYHDRGRGEEPFYVIGNPPENFPRYCTARQLLWLLGGTLPPSLAVDAPAAVGVPEESPRAIRRAGEG